MPYKSENRSRAPVLILTGVVNGFLARQGPFANLHKWGLAQSPSCDCGQRQTMNHTVDTCLLTTFEGGLNLLHEADDDAVIWLESSRSTVEKYKSGLRRHCGFRDLEYPERLNRVGLPSLELRRLHLDLMLCYKIVFGLLRAKIFRSLSV